MATRGYYRFFSYLPLFVFSMIMLVMADNFLTLFVFWEGVGLCSYLLIGYYYKRRSAGNAAKKAFIVNRIGDLGFGLGMMLIFTTLRHDLFFGEQAFSPRSPKAAPHQDPVLDRAAAVHRCDRQERAVPAARLVAGRDGRPDPGVGAHPRRDHGHRRHLPGGALEPDLHAGAGRHARGRVIGVLHRLHRPPRSHHAERHQARRRVLDRQPAWVSWPSRSVSAPG